MSVRRRPPVPRHREPEQSVDRVHQAWRQAESRRGSLEGGQQLTLHGNAIRRAREAIGHATNLQQTRRQPPEAGRGTGKPSPDTSKALSIVIVILHSGGSRRANLFCLQKRQFGGNGVRAVIKKTRRGFNADHGTTGVGVMWTYTLFTASDAPSPLGIFGELGRLSRHQVPRRQFVDAVLRPTIHEACHQFGEIDRRY
jgi:hypothetical protein